MVEPRWADMFSAYARFQAHGADELATTSNVATSGARDVKTVAQPPVGPMDRGPESAPGKFGGIHGKTDPDKKYSRPSVTPADVLRAFYFITAFDRVGR